MSGIWGDDWYVLPDGSAVFKADARPCGKCGAWVFAVVMTPRGCRLQCPDCVRRREGARILGMLDRKTWEMTPDSSTHQRENDRWMGNPEATR